VKVGTAYKYVGYEVLMARREITSGRYKEK
jgi:hypothetical protein